MSLTPSYANLRAFSHRESNTQVYSVCEQYQLNINSTENIINIIPQNK